jgi:hypothetical protein
MMSKLPIVKSSVVGTFLIPTVVCTGLAVFAAVVTKFVIHRVSVRREIMQYDLIIDISSPPDVHPWSIVCNKEMEKSLDVLAICVLGDYKVGKTFLINRVCNLDLPSSEDYHTRGLSIKRMTFPRHRLVWVDTAGQGAPYDMRSERAVDRISLENLVNDLAYQLSDVQIVVTSNCKMRDQELIYSMHNSMIVANRPDKNLLIVVHNFSRITNPTELERAFQTDVVARFHVQRFGFPDRLDKSLTRFVWVDRNDACPTYHLLLGQEGSPAGVQYNQSTYKTIFDMCVHRLGYHGFHNFLESTVFLMNNGLLQRHLNSNVQLKLNEKGTQIIVDNNGDNNNTTDREATASTANSSAANDHNSNHSNTMDQAMMYNNNGVGAGAASTAAYVTITELTDDETLNCMATNGGVDSAASADGAKTLLYQHR